MPDHKAQLEQISPAAVAYAESILDLANEKQQAEAIGLELDQLRQIVDENASFREVLSNPSISAEERQGLLDRVFGSGALSPLVHNTLGVLNRKNRLGLVSEIARGYADLLEEQQGKVEVDLTVAHKLDSDQLERARKRVSEVLKRDAVVHQYVDENIIGGVIVRVGDKLIDASVRHQLAAMREQLMASIPK